MTLPPFIIHHSLPPPPVTPAPEPESSKNDSMPFDRISVFLYHAESKKYQKPRFLMKKLSKQQKLKILSRLYWDLNIPVDEIYNHLYGTPGTRASTVDEANLYRRMLTTLDWYTILKLLPADRLSSLLHENVLQRIFPRDLQRKYRYVGSVLSK